MLQCTITSLLVCSVSRLRLEGERPDGNYRSGAWLASADHPQRDQNMRHPFIAAFLFVSLALLVSGQARADEAPFLKSISGC